VRNFLLLHRIVAALAACVLGLPGIAAAQSAPGAAASPGAREMFGVVDVGISSKVLNELSAGNGASSVGVRAAAELPALGHTFMATLDFQSYSYPHPANNVLPAGLVAACPAGDPGCVTPIGDKLYNSVAPGIALYVPSFRATDSETRFSIGSKITRDNTRLYITAGYLWRTFNYGNAPGMSGFGIGLEKLPDFDRTISLYGSFNAYADMHGSLTGAVNPAVLGALSGIPLNVDYRMFTYRVGATYAFPNSPLFADLNVAGSRLDGRSTNASSDAVHTALSLGVGAHF
jgi:hypothetical protein